MIHLQKPPVFGYETKSVNSDEDFKIRNERKGINCLLACLPLGNFITANSHFFFANQARGVRKAQIIVRGIMHLLFLSPLVALIDAIATGVLNIKHALENRKRKPELNSEIFYDRIERPGLDADVSYLVL